jgi:hypothetical protein
MKYSLFYKQLTTLPLAALALGLAATHANATVTITANTNAAALAAAITASTTGITLTGTPTLINGAATNSGVVAGTFSTTGSNLGIASGIVLSTGNVNRIAGSPQPANNVSNPGTGISNAAASEFDVNTFTFSFIPNPGVTRLSLASVFASEEYNEYVNTTFTDNFSMTINGGSYTNFNFATVPGTAIGTDINSVNNTVNSGYYRDNTAATGMPLPDIVMDGATTVFNNVFNVVPGTTYSVTIRIADVGDAAFDSVVFISTSTVLNNPPSLDLSAAASGTSYTTTWAQGGALVAIAATDDKITDDGTTISSATITITNLAATDLLTAGPLPAGITASAYNSATGTITLNGVATLAQYQTALQAITYSTTSPTPSGPAKTLNVVVNDGLVNSNIAVTTIEMATLSVTKTVTAPTTTLGTYPGLTDAGDTITYTYVVKNTGSVPLTAALPTDIGPKFNGIAGTNALSAFSPAAGVALAVGATQTFTASYTLSANDVSNAVGIINGVSNTASATAKSPTLINITAPISNATTAIVAVPNLTITKLAALTDTPGLTLAKADLNELITYTYTITNTGNVPITNVSVNDIHGAPSITVPLGAGGITSETLTTTGPLGAAASPDATANNGIWSTLAPGATATFKWLHLVNQAEIDHG